MTTDDNIVYDVFISYSSFDRDTAKSVCEFLESKGLKCFIDFRDIPHGSPWASVLPAAIRKSGLMVALCSINYNRSLQVERELAQADKNKVPLLPFRLTDTPYDGAKAYYFENLNWINGFPTPETVYGKLYSDIIDIKEQYGGWTIERRPGHDNVSTTGRTGTEIGGDPTLDTTDYVIDHSIDYRYEDNYQDALDALRNVEPADAAEYLLEPALANYRDSQLRFRLLTMRESSIHISNRVMNKLRHAADNGHGWAQAMMSRLTDFIENNQEAAYEYAIRSAQQKNIFGEFELALMYMFGLNVEQDKEGALDMIKSLERRNFPPAMYQLGKEYIYGWSGNYNPRRGIRILERAIALGDVRSIGEMGQQKLYGEVIEPDFDEAVRLMRQALEGGDLSMLSSLACAYMFNYQTAEYNTGEKISRVMEILNFGINRRDMECMQTLGFIYFNAAEQIGMKPDKALGLKWFLRAAELGHRQAMFNLGNAYYYGDGVKKDNATAWEWFTKAAIRQDGSSEYMRGEMCHNGNAPEPHTQIEALQYYDNALFLGGWGGMNAARQLYAVYRSDAFERTFPTHPLTASHIKGVMLDDNLALNAIRQGALLGDSTCQYLYGCALTDPDRAYSNEIEGLKNLEKALTGNSPCYDAALRLAQLYREGIGVVRDEKKADEYIQFARKNLGDENVDSLLNGNKPAESSPAPTQDSDSQASDTHRPVDFENARKAYNKGLENARSSLPPDYLPLALYWFQTAAALGYGKSAERQKASVVKRIGTAFRTMLSEPNPNLNLLGTMLIGPALVFLPDSDSIGKAYREKRGLALQKKWKELKEEAIFLRLLRLPPIDRNLRFAAGAMALLWKKAVECAAKTTDMSHANACDDDSLISLAESLTNPVWQEFVIKFIETKLELRDFALALNLNR